MQIQKSYGIMCIIEVVFMNIIKTRELVSFDGPCPYKCKHCYTFGLNEENRHLTVDDIVDSLKGKQFDVIYVSHNRENFVVPDEGIDLCTRLFETYNKDIIAITRNIFNEKELERFAKLSEKMKSKGKLLCLAVSIPALDSIEITEGSGIIPSPEKRIEFLKRAKEKNIKTILVIRPLFPNKIIPIREPLEILERCKTFVNCVLSSGLAVNDSILNQLGLSEKDFNYLEGNNSKYLLGAIDGIKYVDVQDEIRQLKEKCKELNINFFDHSMEAIKFFDHSLQAINYLKETDEVLN